MLSFLLLSPNSEDRCMNFGVGEGKAHVFLNAFEVFFGLFFNLGYGVGAV